MLFNINILPVKSISIGGHCVVQQGVFCGGRKSVPPPVLICDVDQSSRIKVIFMVTRYSETLPS